MLQSAYLVTVAQTLANDQAPPHIRTAAGLVLKNAFSYRDYKLLQAVQQKWQNEVDAATKKEVKQLALQTLRSTDSRAGQSAGQFIASIAAIEIPRNQWPELMPQLVENVGNGPDSLKQASLVTIGFICESEDSALREALTLLSNSILTAVVQGARKEEPNPDVRFAGITALSDSIEFVKTNFDNEGERNYIMQVICEATQASDSRIQAGAFGCLNRVVSLYYDYMKFYMEKALYGLSVVGMRSEDEDVAKLAIDFWCTLCEEEIQIEDDNSAADEGFGTKRPNHYFTRVGANEIVPVLLQMLANQDEDAADEEYNTHKAAYMCLSLFAAAVGNEVVQVVAQFVEQFVRDADWHRRDAAMSAFGAIMDGPHEDVLIPLVRAALPAVMEKMQDPDEHVRDSTAYTLGRICEFVPRAIDEQSQLPAVIEALFTGVTSTPRMATSCCWALVNISMSFGGEPGVETNALSPHFQASVGAIVNVTEKNETNNALRIAAYEVLNSFVLNAASDRLTIVAQVGELVLQRLQGTLAMQQQVVSVDDKLVLEEMQNSLASCLVAVIQRLEGGIRPLADRIMEVLLSLLSNVSGKSSVPDAVFATVGSLANALDEDMEKYMTPFTPFLHSALGSHEEPSLVAMAIGLVSDLARALNEKIQPYCDHFMNYLLEALRSNSLGNQCKPAILQCFGDIANAIGAAFEAYLATVGGILQQAAHVGFDQTGHPMDMMDYLVSLREGIVDAWSGVIFSTKGKPEVLAPYVEPIFQLIQTVAMEDGRSEGLMRSALGVIG